jgi:DNA-directed RNA polymerase specialized sigma24 family protein
MMNDKAPAYKKKDWVLTPEAFNRLLAHLNTDRERAGELYENIRNKLVKFFEWRNCLFAEDYADETLNRVARRIEEGEGISSVQSYSYGVARMLFMEVIKEQEKWRATIDKLPTPVAVLEDNTERERQMECFEKCLAKLSDENRYLIVEYYQKEKRVKIEGRRLLAERLKLPLNALRIRAHRIRLKLELCISDCVGQTSYDEI